MKVVQLASNPIGGSPYELNKLLNTYSKVIESRFIVGSPNYRNEELIPMRKFPTDLIWNKDKKECIKIIKEADIIHCHNTVFLDDLKSYCNDKTIIVLQLYSVNRRKLKVTGLLQQGLKLADVVVIVDQPWQKRVYKDISNIYLPLVRNLFDYNKFINKMPHVIYSPTNRLPLSHMYSKGYNEVISIINKLKKEGLDFQFTLIEGVDYKMNLYLKSFTDIIIDDVVNKNAFHNTSLEGACFGAISLTNYSGTDYPFIQTNLSTLEEKLRYYIINSKELKKEQDKIIIWQRKYYNAEVLLKKYENFYKGIK